MKRVAEVIEAVALSSVIDKRARDLSYGEQKLLALSRALAGRPKLLLLDEPFSGLADESIKITTGLVQQFTREGGTVVIVDHNMEGVMGLAERVIVLDRGRVLADGTPAVIAANSAVQSAYLGVA